MLILALDTTSHQGSFALARDGEVIDSYAVDAPDGFGQIVYQHIDALLKKHGATLADIDCYAATSGPGSFTGIRIGLTTVKALAEVHGKRVVAVSNLEALASLVEGLYRAPVIDARRGEVYAAVYDEQLRMLVEETAVAWPSFVKSLGDREVTAIAQDVRIFQPGGAAALQAGVSARFRCVAASEPLAAAVARLACQRYARGQTLVPEAVDANYVRRSDAELKWKEAE